MRPFRRPLIAVLTTAMLLVQTLAAAAGDGSHSRHYPPTPPITVQSFPSDPGEPTP